MSVGKLQRFAELEQLPNVIQPIIKYPYDADNELKGKWRSQIFKNNNPIVLELGCGKGEYSIAFAKKHKDKNFVGIDIKGARIWIGAKEAIKENLSNIAFLRINIDFIDKFFDKDEISEIWIPHPDPQPKKPKKRLTSDFFLSLYQKFISNNALIHLKTDSSNLYQYTLDLLEENKIEIIENYADIHSAGIENEITKVETYFEKMFLEQGSKIKYLSFRLNNSQKLVCPKDRYIPKYKY